MSLLCTVTIPSRRGIDRLTRAITSVNCWGKDADYEILVRLDDDDAESLASIDRVRSLKNTQVFTGPRLGYENLDTGYYTELANLGKGKWVWICGDDTIVSGQWCHELAKVPSSGYIVQPEFSRLGGSIYPKAEGQAFPMFPKDCWKMLKPHPGYMAGHIPKAADVNLDAALKQQLGWKTWFLPGVMMYHDEQKTGGQEAR